MSVVDHVDALVLDVLRVLAHELEDVLDESLVGQAPESDTVLASAGGDEVLRERGRRDRRDRLEQLPLERLDVADPIQNLVISKQANKQA